jgi:hypothetical protein
MSEPELTGAQKKFMDDYLAAMQACFGVQIKTTTGVATMTIIVQTIRWALNHPDYELVSGYRDALERFIKSVEDQVRVVNPLLGDVIRGDYSAAFVEEQGKEGS